VYPAKPRGVWAPLLLEYGSAIRVFWQPVRTLLLGAGSAQALTIVFVPVLARLYGPVAFGRFSIYFGIVGIVGAAAALKFEVALQVARNDATAIYLRRAGAIASLWWMLGGFALSLPALAAARPDLAVLALTGGAGSGLVGLWLITSHWQLREGAFKQVAFAKVAQSAGGGIAQLGLFAFGYVGLIAGDLIGRCVAVLTVHKGRLLQLYIHSPEPNGVFSEYRRYPLYAAPAAMVNSAGLYLVPVIMFFFYGAEEAGIFGLMFRLISLPVALIGTAVAQVYVREAGQRIAAAQYADAYRLAWQFVTMLSAAGLLILLCVVVFGPTALPMVLGPKWSGAGSILLPLSIAAVAQFAVSPVSQTLNVIGDQTTQLLWDLGRLSVVVGALATAYGGGLTFTGAVWLYSVASASAYVALWIISSTRLDRLRSAAAADDSGRVTRELSG
jgi:O-antigen/teichoic acid export membrane protein